MSKLAEFREKNPAYKDVPDEKLAPALHKKFYSNIPQEEFFKQVGFTPIEEPGMISRGLSALGDLRKSLQQQTNDYEAQQPQQQRVQSTPQDRATPLSPLDAASLGGMAAGMGPVNVRTALKAEQGADPFLTVDSELLNAPGAFDSLKAEQNRREMDAFKGSYLEGYRKEGELSRRLEGDDARQFAQQQYDKDFAKGDPSVKPAEASWKDTFNIGATQAGRGMARGFYATLESVGDMVGATDLAKYAAEDRAQQEEAIAGRLKASLGKVPEDGFKSIVGDAIPTIISQGAPIAAAALATVATRNPEVGKAMVSATVLAPMGVQSYGNAYADGKAQGLALEDRVTYGVGTALAEVLPERISLGYIMDLLTKPLKAGGKKAAEQSVVNELAKRFLQMQATEMTTEQVTTVSQFLLDRYYTNPDLSLKDLQEQMVRTALVTPVATTALGAAGAAGSMAGAAISGRPRDLTAGMKPDQAMIDALARQSLDPSNAQMAEVIPPSPVQPPEGFEYAQEAANVAPPLDAASYQGPGADPAGSAGLARDGRVGDAGTGIATGAPARSGEPGVSVGEAERQQVAGVVEQKIAEKEAEAAASGDPIELLVTRAEGAAMRRAVTPQPANGIDIDQDALLADVEAMFTEGGNLMVQGDNAREAVKRIDPKALASALPRGDGALLVPKRFAGPVMDALQGAKQRVSVAFGGDGMMQAPDVAQFRATVPTQEEAQDVPTSQSLATQAQEAGGQEGAQETRDDLIARYAQAEPFSDEEVALSDRLKDATRTEVGAKISAGEMPVFETGRDTFATITPSAQQPGMFQVTRYNRSGVMGDSQYRSVDDALAGEFFHQKRMIPQAEAEQRFAEALQAEAEYQARTQQPTQALTAPEQSRPAPAQTQAADKPKRQPPARKPDPVTVDRAQRNAEDLRAMAQDAGWAEEGRKLIRDAEGKASRTKWIPRAEWFLSGMEARPDVLAQHIEAAARGEWIPVKSARTIEGMVEWLDAQRGQATLDEDASMYDFEASFGDVLDVPDAREVAEFFDDAFGDFAEQSEADAMRAMGFTEEEIANAGGQTQAGAGSAETADARGTAAAGERAGEAGAAQEEAGQGQREGLTAAPVYQQTFDQWLEQKWSASRYKDAYIENADGDVQQAKYAAVSGGGKSETAARNAYWSELIRSPRDADVSIEMYDGLTDAQKHDASRHFFKMDDVVRDRLMQQAERSNAESERIERDVIGPMKAELDRLQAMNERTKPGTDAWNRRAKEAGQLEYQIAQLRAGRMAVAELPEKWRDDRKAAKEERAKPMLQSNGKPFPSEKLAAESARQRKLDMVPVEVDGGWGLVAGLPEQGVTYREGKGRAKGQWIATLEDGTEGNAKPSKNEALEDARRLARTKQASNQRKTEQAEALERAISKASLGGSLTDADLVMAGLTPNREGNMDWLVFSQVVRQELGLTPRQLKPMVRGAIFEIQTPAGGQVERVDPRKAMVEIAKSRASAEPLTLDTYTNADIAQREAEQAARAEDDAKAEREAAAKQRQAEERAEVRRRSEAAADTFELGMDPMENLTGQGDIFSQPAPQTAPQEDGDWLMTLFGEDAGNAKEQMAQIGRDEARKAKTQAERIKALRGAMDSVRKDLQAQYDDWAGRVYKKNKNMVELQGDGPSSQAAISVGSINENRRRRAMEALNDSLQAVGRLEKQIATDQGVKDMLRTLDRIMDRAKQLHESGNFTFLKSQDAAFEYILLDDALKMRPANGGSLTSNEISRAMLAFMKQPTQTPKAPEQSSSIQRSESAQPTSSVVPAGVTLNQSQKAELAQGGSGMAGEIGEQTMRSLAAMRNNPNVPSPAQDAETGAYSPSDLPEFQDVGDGFSVRGYALRQRVVQEIKLPNGMIARRVLNADGTVYGEFEGDYDQIVGRKGFAEAEQYFRDFAKAKASHTTAPRALPSTPAQQGGLKFSRKQNNDAEYLAAVGRGDMEAAQRMVDQAARDADYVSDTEYRMQHRAPNRESDVSLVDLRDADLVPSDYWTKPEWYQGTPEEMSAWRSVTAAMRRMDARKADGKNPGMVAITVYRAVPKGVKDGAVRNGDWVTPSREYAVNEGQMIPGGYRIIAQQALMRNLFWDGNSIAELGYDDGQPYAYRNTKNNRKLLEAVTYDDDGNVIPLSKRFNARSDDARFSFAGQNAETADIYRLINAKERIEKGEDAERVRRETGWLRGVDGRWRFEISDDEAQLSKTDGFVAGEEYALASLLDHPKLFAAYPDLRNMAVRFVSGQSWGGQYDPSTDSVDINIDRGFDERGPLSILMHEIQHAIQQREGFARGGAPDPAFTKRVKEALASLDAHERERVEQWKWGEGYQAVKKAERTSEAARYALMYESARRLMSYANHERPSSVFRLLRNEMQWIYAEDFRGNAEARDLQLAFYDIPKPSRMRARNIFLRDMASRAADLLESKIPDQLLNEFRGDERTTKSMVAALRRQADRASKDLAPLKALERAARAAAEIKKAHEYAGPHQIYSALAGEVEARNTQARLAMTEGERRTKSPLATADVSPDQIIVMFGGLDIRAPMAAMAPENAHRTGFTRESLIQSISVRFPSLTRAVESALRRGDEGKPGGVVVVERAEDLAGTFASKTGRTLEEAQKSLQASIRAWHGSPYRFDRFDLGNVGMGEGAQAYGWGLYFADSKEVAEHYRSMGGYSLTPANDAAKARFSEVTNFAWGAVQGVSDALENNKGDIGKTVARLRNFYADTNRPEMREAYLAIADMLESGDLTAKREGATYKVKIAPAEDTFLLWDKPLSEQSAKVREALKRRLPDPAAYDGMDMGGNAVLRDNRSGKYRDTVQPWLLETTSANGKVRFGLSQKDVDRMVGAADDANLTGQQIYSRFTADKGSQKAASELLARAGVRGIKYLDGQSRDSKGGSFNYVVFDDADVEIVDVQFSQHGDIQGFFDSRSGLTFLVAPNLTERTAPAVLLHEATHGKQRAEIDRKAMELIETRQARSKPLRDFLFRVEQRMDAAGESGNASEAAAYIVEEAVVAGRQAGFSAVDGKLMNWIDLKFGRRVSDIVRDFVAMVRAWAMRAGVEMNPTVDDLVAIAKLNVRDMARGDVTGGEGAKESRINFSRAGQATMSAPATAAQPAQAAPRAAQAQATPPDETRFQAFQRKAQDKLNRFTVIKEWLAAQGVTLSEQADVYKAEERMHSRFANKAEDFREKTVKPLVEKIQRAGYSMDDVAQYLHAQHAEERNIQVASINKQMPDGGSGMKTADANAILAAAPAELKRLANEFRAITERTKQILLDNGIISQDMADAWDAAYQHYVPLKGGPEQGGKGAGKGLKANYKGKRALGHTMREEGEWIVENILADHERAIMIAEKNRIGQSLLKMAIEVGRDDLLTVGKPEKRGVLKNNAAYEVLFKGKVIGSFQSLEAARTFRATAPAAMKGASPSEFGIRKVSDPTVAYMASPMLADNEVNVYVKGQAIRVQINDELLARAYGNMGTEALGAILRVGATINGYFSKIYTGYNPEFILTNIVRDFTTGVANVTGEEGAMMALRAAKDYPASFADLFRYATTGNASQWIRMYREDGGNTGGAYLSDLERLGDEISAEYAAYKGVLANLKAGDVKSAARAAGRKAFDKTLVWVERINQAGENAMRLSIYKAMIESGKSRAEAASLAKNATVNFNRNGEVGRQMNALWLFYNAGVQGTAAIAHANFKGKHKRQANAVSAGILGLGYALATAIGASDDEDDYDKLSGYTKERNVVFKTGEGWVKIPVPYGYGFFWNMGRAIADAERKGEWGDAPWHVAASFVEEFTPFGAAFAGDEFTLEQFSLGALPTLAQIPVSVAMNRTTMAGPMRPESAFDKHQPDNEKMWRGTKGTLADELAQAMAQGGIEVSPETMKYLMRTFTGGAGTFVTSIADAAWLTANGASMEVKEVPFARKFYTETDVREARGAYYKAVGEAEKVVRKGTSLLKMGDYAAYQSHTVENQEMYMLDAMAKAYAKAIRASRDYADTIRTNKELGIKEKREQLKEIEDREQVLYDQYLGVFKSQTRK